MSLNCFNALQMYKKNRAYSYMKSLTPEEHKTLQKLAHDQDSSGNNCAIKHTMAQHIKNVASQNADKDCTHAARIACAEEAIDGCDLYWISQTLEEAYKIWYGANGYLTVAALDLQLDWHIKKGKNSLGLEIPKAKSGAKGRGSYSQVQSSRDLAVEAEHEGAETEVESSQEKIIDVDIEEQDDKMCQIDKDNSHKWRSAEYMGFGEAISNITLELKP
ncbi:hypothetical protein ARMGADRAFT_1027596 [Armillaria gallica]|uniref:Uncharacterized protein n=1 Tax=Armillaria gallica TaxID=47427 RepID=A0A2H3DYP4_ARMGA|nr:hypothetical protein ARMGADRAFT_1027596 [Armillaria gallica]